jgi:hypothetical protein
MTMREAMRQMPEPATKRQARVMKRETQGQGC